MGNVIDGLWAVVVVVLVLTIALSGMYVLEQFGDVVNEEFPGVPEAEQATEDAQDWLALTDTGIVLAFFSYILVILLVAYLLPSNVAYTVLMFVIILVQIPVADVMQHFVNELINTAEFATYADSFPMTLLIIDNSPILLVITAILAAVIQFGKGSMYGTGYGGGYRE